MVDRLEYSYKRRMGKLHDWQKKYNDSLREKLESETPEEKQERHDKEDMEYLRSVIKAIPTKKIEKLRQLIDEIEKAEFENKNII